MRPHIYQSEKLSVARSCLMLPHPRGEADSIAMAFHECELAFQLMDENALSESAKEWIATIKGFMDTTGLKDPDGHGLFYVKAKSLTEHEKAELSRTIDDLAHWFDREFWTKY